MSLNKMQQAARDLHALGFKTLPIKPGTKEPATKHGVKDATSDDAATDAFYEANQDYGIAIAGDGFLIFDFDVKDGVDGRDQLTGWKLPDTMSQTTPSGGYHLIYRADREIRPSVNQEIAVDVRGWHSYVVCDPTPGYCFEDDTEPAMANDAVYAFLEHVRPKQAKVPTKPKSSKSSAVGEGGRNDYLFRAGSSLRSDEKNTDDLIIAYLQALNKTNCQPPLDDAELNKLINSVLALPVGLSDEAKAAQQQSKGSQPRFNHTKIAKTLISEHHACFIDGVPAVFINGRYETGWDAINRAIIMEHETASSTNRKEVREYIALVAPKVNASPPNLIAFKNGVLDVLTMEFRDFAATDIIQNVIPHNWNPQAESKIVDETLRKLSCGDPVIELNLSEFMGLCMYRSGELAYFPILLGRKGKNASNGKSTYIKMIRAMLGKENYSSLSFNDLGQHFMKRYIAGKLANLGDDISSKRIDSDALEVVKKAASGDSLFCDVKNGSAFEFESYTTFVFSANKMPNFETDDDGINRRMFPLRFNARFTRDNPDFNPKISKLLEQEDACERMIVKAIEGLKRCIDNNGPTPNSESMAMLDDIKTMNNSIRQWMKDVERDADSFIGCQPTPLFNDYRQWCTNAGIQKPFSKPGFGKMLTELFAIESHVESIEGEKRRVYRYIER